MGRGRKKKKQKVNGLVIFLLTFLLILSVGGLLILTVGFIMDGGGDLETASLLVSEQIPETESLEEGTSQQNLQEDALPAEPGRYDAILQDEAYLREQNIYPWPAAKEGEVTLAFAGDILFDPGYSMIARMNQRAGGIYDSISAPLMEEMKAADIMMLNNEFPYSARGVPTPEKQYTFRAKPESASLLHDMGVDIVSLANNHAYDYGEEALIDSLDTLNQAEIKYVGAGRDLEEAAKPVYFISNDIKIGYLAATQIERLENPDTRGAAQNTPGVFRCWNPEKLLEVIRETKKNCDFLIVYIHWGTENTEVIDWAQEDQAPKIAEAGADLIIGDHPHCLQKLQYIGDVPVIYSVGNFWFNSRKVDTCLVKAVIDKEGLKSFQFVPALQEDSATTLLEGGEKERVLSYMRSISGDVNIDAEGFVTKK